MVERSMHETLRNLVANKQYEEALKLLRSPAGVFTEHAALAARVAELEHDLYEAQNIAWPETAAALKSENERLRLDKQDLFDAIQPLLGCADYARERDLSGHETLIVTASEAYDAASAMTRIEARASLSNQEAVSHD